MAYIVEVENPLEPTRSRKHKVAGGISIRSWLEREYPGFVEFPVPTVCVVNGEGVLRADWSRIIQEHDVIQFVTIPQGIYLIIAAVIVAAIVLSITIALSIPVPKVPGEAPASDPVFSTKGQSNAIRLGEPIEVCYGRNRIYPSLASRPYFAYIHNDQFQYTLFCLGQGEFDIEQLLIGDTNITSYAEVVYEIIPPGSPVTLFPADVFTSLEVGGQTLFGPNEPEYVAPGWIGPFVANPSGTLTRHLEIDLIFPKGLYFLTDRGNLLLESVNFEWQAQLIDDVGTPIGPWIALNPTVTYFNAASTTPQRRSLDHSAVVLAAGRYQTRIRRTNNKDLSYKAGNDVVLDGLRATSEGPAPDYGDVTLIAVKIRASNNLNERSNLQFNTIATRKLPIYESGGGMTTELFPTRSIVWAFVDVMRSHYGGRLPTEKFYDWDTLLALDAIYASRGDHFDWVFRDPITVWAGAQTIARVGRAVPLLAGSLLTLKRDAPQDIPVAMFTPDNIVSKAFQWEVKLWDLDEKDSARIEYTDPTTGFKQEQVTAVLPGETADNPEDVRFAGIASRAQAYREGMYLRATRRYLRENVTFDTGLEGYIPTYGELIAISHDTPNWGQAGYVVHAQLLDSEGHYQLWLSEPLRWLESGDCAMLLRGRHGEVIGPITPQPTTDSMQVVVLLPDSGSFDFLLGGENEPMLFQFGLVGRITKYVKIVQIEPQGNEVVRITAVNDDARLFEFDDIAVPALGTPSLAPKTPDLPVVSRLFLSLPDPTLQIVQVAWAAAFGAQYYIIQVSNDGVNWSPTIVSTHTSLRVQAPSIPGEFWVRVAAVNKGQGLWIQDSIALGTLTGLDLLTPWDGLSWKIGWLRILSANRYRVQVYDDSGISPILKHDQPAADLEFPYDYTQAVTDSNVVRKMLVKINPIIGGVDSDYPVETVIQNSIPAPPASPFSTFDSDTGLDRFYRLHWTVPHEDDLIQVRWWLSATPGFNPATTPPYGTQTAGSPGWAGIDSSVLVSVPLTAGSHPAYYWRAGLFDVWGTEIGTNLTSEQVIPAYP